MNGYRTQLSVPLGTSARPRAPGTVGAAGRRLIEVRTAQPITRALLDALGLPGWLIVAAVRWDGTAPAGSVVEPLDAALLTPHCPDGVIPHHWTGWGWCA